ncbi:MAG: PEP-utilizing enzyme [Vicinamibacterales bacterium]
MTTSALPPFVPPSPGAWELERTHFTRPISRFATAVFPAAMKRGFGDATRAYGALLDYIELAVVNGVVYSAARPVGAPKGAKGHPPRPVFWLLQRLHPEIRRRIKRADEVFAQRFWREELRWWDSEVKPMLASEARALLAEDLLALSDHELSSHVQRAAEFAGKTIFYHHRLNCCAILPIGDFIAHAVRWTGESPERVLLALRGLSPLSAGASAELDTLRVAIAADPEATSILKSGRSAALVLDEIAVRASVAAPLRAYLDTVGWRVLGGYDVSERHARDYPELLVKIISAAVANYQATATKDAGAAVVALRATVPSEHQAGFDALLEEARLVYRVRDERNFCSDALGTGIARRVILEAGRRLSAQGLARDPGHLVDATPEEISALLEGRGGPSADELASRVHFRETTSLDSVPQLLGVPPSPPPPADWLPTSAARLQRAIDMTLGLMFNTPVKQEGQGRQLKGFGVSPGVFEGPARVILDVSELATVLEGEVLVTPSTGPTFNVVLPLLKGLVTERGGALSHAAIVAREYGIPGVVGCRDAASRIKTGMRIGVDGAKGEVWIIE